MPSTSNDVTREALDARLARPQRHRLLQGYPAMPQMRASAPRFGTMSDGVRTLRGELRAERGIAAANLARVDAQRDSPGAYWTSSPALRERFEAQVRPGLERTSASLKERLATPDPSEPPFVSIDASRTLIVGVIPHTQCTPKVDGCGFCTFPHDAPDKRVRSTTIEVVGDEAAHAIESEPGLRGRTVTALYFGGGTANLAKPEQIEGLFRALAKNLRLEDAEVSLEGVAALFTTWFHAPLKMLERLPVRQRRISMGIQTFDDAVIASMGRSGFGDARVVRKLVERAHAMNITTSGDFLFNLPGQSLRAMLDDVDRAVEYGLDQICLYNLVLYEGLGTAWSKDPEKRAAMPDNETACANWIALRERLLAAGFVQTTVTNFERREVAESARAFQYERLSFSPEKTDALGFGPMSLSLLVDPAARRAVKHQRSKNLMAPAFSGDDLSFLLDAEDLRLLFVTRSLAKGAFDLATYARFCGSSFALDFAASIPLLAGLLTVDDERVMLTPRGMFFSDAVVGTLLSERPRAKDGAGVHTHTALSAPLNAASYDGMG